MFFSTVRNATLRGLKPLFDRVVVERLAPETKTKAGILLPEKATGKVLEGTVVAAGPGGRNDKGETVPISLKTGDRVLLPEFGGFKIAIDEKEYHIFRESEIVGKFE